MSIVEAGYEGAAAEINSCRLRSTLAKEISSVADRRDATISNENGAGQSRIRLREDATAVNYKLIHGNMRTPR
jgi:hypothetical protein